MSRSRIAVHVAVPCMLVLAGVVVGAIGNGDTSTIVAFALAGIGGVIAVADVFLQVGYSEDRERLREQAAHRPPASDHPPRLPRGPRIVRRR